MSSAIQFMYTLLWVCAERSFLEAVSNLAFCNPFLPERAEHERAALGGAYVEDGPVWSISVDEPEKRRSNVWRIVEKLEPLIVEVRARLASGVPASGRDLGLYQDAALHILYQRYYPRFYQAAFGGTERGAVRWRFYNQFLAEWKQFFEVGRVAAPAHLDSAHTFACFRQIQRAFDEIFRAIIGNSMPAARLRAGVWQSIFTHDIRRYRRTLYARMGEFATLITGPSGSGKELVARAISQSRYLAIEARSLTFTDDEATLFFPINISALSPALVESELFGHRRGAFTGAIADRKGWLEMCPPPGSVFLDELGDLDPSIQVKLLRVIETRTFHPVGDTASLPFRGKIVAATNRDLAALMSKGEFREDLYYRLCSDQIATPALAEQLADSPGVLRDLVFSITRRFAGEEGEGLAPDVVSWVTKNLGLDYGWPGNYRELEQCVKNVLIRRDYKPVNVARSGDEAAGLAADIRSGRLTADELLSRYCGVVYRQTGSYEETARRLKLDRRTVKSYITRGT
jgi:transcriptional regulator with AAA-type ATPase domain